MTIQVITGTTGIVTKGLKKNSVAIPGKHSTDSLQMIAVLGIMYMLLAEPEIRLKHILLDKTSSSDGHLSILVLTGEILN
jgi:hypothetical protein